VQDGFLEGDGGAEGAVGYLVMGEVGRWQGAGSGGSRWVEFCRCRVWEFDLYAFAVVFVGCV